GGSQLAVDRVKRQIQTGRVASEHAARALSVGTWLEGLTEDQFAQLLQAIAGANMVHAPAAIEMLSTWVEQGRPLQGKIATYAWSFLAHEPLMATSFEEGWKFDQLAARLTESAPDRGFRLLERLVRRQKRDTRSWDPLDIEGEQQFWKALHAT